MADVGGSGGRDASLTGTLEVDVAAIAGIAAVPKILDVVCHATGMGFAAVARVTEERWVACAVRDALDFGLVPGGELDVRTTICDEIRCSGELVVFDHASIDARYEAHPTPKLYGFESYISVPINRSDGSFFGTLCALDPRPVPVERAEIVGMFVLFADLIAAHLDGADRMVQLAAERAALQANEARLTQQQAVMAQQLADLGDREERLRLALDGGSLGMWDADPRTGEVIWSEHHAAMQGYLPSDEPQSLDQWQRLVHPDDSERIEAAIDRARRDGGLFAEQHRFHRADTHELRWMSLYGRFFYDESGDPIRFTGVSQDITDRKLAEESLRAQEEHERRVALTLQAALLPSTLRRHPAIDMEIRYQAADLLSNVGGDWYDTFAWPDGSIGLVVGDVVGHSIESAATMGRLRAAAAALATQLPPDPGLFLEALDVFARGPDGTDFATAMCLIVDPDRATLTYSLAGHPPPILATSDGRASLLDRALAVPLCVGPVERRPTAAVSLAPDTVVVAYTDGLVERRGESIADGINRLLERVTRLADRPVAVIAQQLVSSVTGEGATAADDVVVACLRYTPLAALNA
jgi:PAS domain S-box-containing protein